MRIASMVRGSGRTPVGGRARNRPSARSRPLANKAGQSPRSEPAASGSSGRARADRCSSRAGIGATTVALVHRVARLRAWPLALGLTLGLVGPAVAADPVPSLNLRNYRPSTDPKAILYLEPVVTPGPAEWNVGALVLVRASPGRARGQRGARVSVPVRHQLSLDYTANIGLGERLAFGLSLPTVLYQDGDDLPASAGASPLPVTALGDPSLVAKAALLPPGELGRVRARGARGSHAAYRESGVLHRGSQRDGRSPPARRARPRRAHATRDGRRARARQRATIRGRHVRARPALGSRAHGPSASVRPRQERALGLDPRDPRRRLPHRRVRFGRAVTGRRSASVRATRSARPRWCSAEGPPTPPSACRSCAASWGCPGRPRFYDADNDGFEDEDDDCPELAEDRDGFEDNDGCPGLRQRRRRRRRREDRCPHELEDSDGHLERRRLPRSRQRRRQPARREGRLPERGGAGLAPTPVQNGGPLGD